MSKIKIKVKKPKVELKPIKDMQLLDKGKNIINNVGEGGKEAISVVADKVFQVKEDAVANAALQKKKKEIITEVEKFNKDLKRIMCDEKDLRNEFADDAYSITHLMAKYLKEDDLEGYKSQFKILRKLIDEMENYKPKKIMPAEKKIEKAEIDKFAQELKEKYEYLDNLFCMLVQLYE